jgi:hypothetical protein
VSNLRVRLIETVRHDAYTGPAWGPYFGYGKADAYAAVLKLTGVADSRGQHAAEGFVLLPNYPNPFNAFTAIDAAVPGPAGRLSFEILDMAGRTVKQWTPAIPPGGAVRVVWDGRVSTGLPAPSGVYIYRLTSGKTVLSRKMVFIR